MLGGLGGMNVSFFSLQIRTSVTQFLGASSFEVSWAGFLLVAEASKWSDHPPPPIHKVDLDLHLVGQSIGELAAYAARQPLWPVDLYIDEVDCSTATEGQALVGLLQQCQRWAVYRLRLTGSVDKHFWAGLASSIPDDWEQSAIRPLKYIRLGIKVMARGSLDHLRKIWRFTGAPRPGEGGANWWVYGSDEPIYHQTRFGAGVDREEDGWKEIVLVLDKEVTAELVCIWV